MGQKKASNMLAKKRYLKMTRKVEKAAAKVALLRNETKSAVGPAKLALEMKVNAAKLKGRELEVREVLNRAKMVFKSRSVERAEGKVTKAEDTLVEKRISLTKSSKTVKP